MTVIHRPYDRDSDRHSDSTCHSARRHNLSRILTTCREFSLRLNACCSTQMWFPITILRALCVIHTDFRDFRAEPRQAEKLFPLLGLGSDNWLLVSARSDRKS